MALVAGVRHDDVFHQASLCHKQGKNHKSDRRLSDCGILPTYYEYRNIKPYII